MSIDDLVSSFTCGVGILALLNGDVVLGIIFIAYSSFLFWIELKK